MFKFVDFEYLDGLFSEDGAVDFALAQEKKTLTDTFESAIADNLNRETRRNDKNTLSKELKEKQKEMDC